MDLTDMKALLTRRWPRAAVRGVATTAMLSAAGLPHQCLEDALRRGLILRLHRGSYISAVAWAALTPWAREETQLVSHVLASHSTGIYSHASAARLHGLGTWGCGAQIHLTHTHPPGSPGRRAPIIAHRQPLDPASVVEVRVGPLRVPVTSLPQTVIDCSRYYDVNCFVAIGDQALRRGLSVQQLLQSLRDSPTVRGSARAAHALTALDARSESVGESRTRILLAASGLPMPELQVDIPTRHGLRRVDFAWPEHRLILEFDGWGKYFNYQPTSQVLAQERLREKDLMELGWRFLRIQWADLQDPVELSRRIRVALLTAGAVVPRRRTPLMP